VLHFADLSFREAAKHCGVTHSAMRRRYARAVEKSGGDAVKLGVQITLGLIPLRPATRRMLRGILE